MQERLETLREEHDLDNSATLNVAEAQALRDHLWSRVRGEHFIEL